MTSLPSPDPSVLTVVMCIVSESAAFFSHDELSFQRKVWAGSTLLPVVKGVGQLSSSECT